MKSTTKKKRDKPTKTTKKKKAIAGVKKRIRVFAAAADETLMEVSLAINLGENAPSDVALRAQIDSKQLPLNGGVGKALVNPGKHTASWTVVSLSVRPLKFGVSIKSGDEALLDRPNEKTGSDGKGVGADEFTVKENA